MKHRKRGNIGGTKVWQICQQICLAEDIWQIHPKLQVCMDIRLN